MPACGNSAWEALIFEQWKRIRARNTFKLKIAWTRVYTFAFSWYPYLWYKMCKYNISYDMSKTYDKGEKSLLTHSDLCILILHIVNMLGHINPRILARKRVQASVKCRHLTSVSIWQVSASDKCQHLTSVGIWQVTSVGIWQVPIPVTNMVLLVGL